MKQIGIDYSKLSRAEILPYFNETPKAETTLNLDLNLKNYEQADATLIAYNLEHPETLPGANSHAQSISDQLISAALAGQHLTKVVESLDEYFKENR